MSSRIISFCFIVISLFATLLCVITRAQDSRAPDSFRLTLHQALIQTADAASGEKNAEEKAGALALVGEALSLAGDRPAARANLQKAIEATATIKDPRSRARALSGVTASASSASECDIVRQCWDEMGRIIPSIQYPHPLFTVYSRFLSALVHCGERAVARAAIDQAIQLYGDRKRSAYLATVMSAPIDAQLKEGAITEAVKTAEDAIQRVQFSQDLIPQIAQALGVKNRDEAKPFLERLHRLEGVLELGSVDRASSLTAIAEAEARLGLLEEAIRTADSIPIGRLFFDNRPIFDQASALAKIAAIVAAAGNKTTARKLIRQALDVAQGEEAEGTLPFDSSFATIAEVQAGMGDLTEAKRTIEMIGSQDEHRAKAYSHTFKARALVALARAQAEAKNQAAALVDCRQAMESAAKAEPHQRPFILRDTALIVENVDGFQAAINIANQIEEPAVRSWTLIKLIRSRGKAKDVSGLWLAANAATEKDEMTGDHAQAIAGALTEAGHASEALQWALKLPSPCMRAGALLGIYKGHGR